MNIYEEILELEKNNKPFVIATVVNTSGSTPGKIGFKMLIKDSGIKGTVGGGAIEDEVVKEALKRISTSDNGVKEYLLSESDVKNPDTMQIPMKCSGRISIFYEVHNSMPVVHIFGGGHVGSALLYYLAPLNYHTILIDNRKEFANKERNPFAKEIICKEYLKFLTEFNPPPNSFAVILTYSHKFDFEILKTIYERGLDLKYIGVIASKSKASSMIKELKEGVGEEIGLSNLHTPVGLNIGGNTAEEIALAIAAEIQKVNYER